MQDAAETRTSADAGHLPATSSSIDEGRFVPGTLIVGRYRIISLLGRGGMGEVYRATDLTLGQPVALKFLPNTGEGFERMLERFQNEVRVARQVSHPNVCRVYDLGEFEGMPYMSMEYVDGEDLAGLLARIGRLPEDKALDIARRICAGLAAAHDKGVIHRDLKPANIMLDKRGNAIIMDFGLAAVTNELRGAEARSGSPAYQAPEQLRGEAVTARSDIYALGLVLYEVFTGKRTYDAKSIAELMRLQERGDFAAMNSVAVDIDPAVEKAIRKCLNPVAVERPPSALSVSAMLPGGDPLTAALAAGETPSPELVAAAGRHEGLKLKYSIPIALATLAFLVALPFLRHDREIHSFTPLELAPEVLAAKARELAASFGYVAGPADRDFWIVEQTQISSEARKAGTSSGRHLEEVRRWFLAEPPMRLVYRESPAAMLTTDGRVSLDQPAPVTSGMIAALLTTGGELRQFSAVPLQVGGTASAAAVETALLSRATGFDLSLMEPVPPQFTPLYAFNWQQAWKGKHPRLGVDIQVEAAAWNGRLTHLQIIWPWTIASRMPDAQAPTARRTMQQILWNSMIILVVLFSILLATRNMRAGRGDRMGALRLAAMVFVLRSIETLAQIHWAADMAMFPILVKGLSIDLAQAGGMWLLYLAVEPAVRARWPRVLVSWTRVLQGKWRDPLVATRVLQGAFTAAVIVAIVLGSSALQTSRGVLINPVDASRGISVRHTVADLAGLARTGITLGMLMIFVIFLFRTVLKRDWAAALAMAVVMTAINDDTWRFPNVVDVAIYVTVMAGVAFVMLRLGLVATIVTATVVDVLMHTPGAQDLTKWYEWTVIFYPLVAGLLVVWAFWGASHEELMRPDA